LPNKPLELTLLSRILLDPAFAVLHAKYDTLRQLQGSTAPAVELPSRYCGGNMKKLYSLIAVTVLAMSVSCNLPGNNTSIVPIQTPGSIRGILWHEICKYSGGEAGQPLVLGQGCVQWGTLVGEFGPNQSKDDFESGWTGVTLHLGSGACPSTGLATAITNASGEYQFEGLNAGTYCVSYSNITDGNDALLIPGGPTFPKRGYDGFFVTINLLAAEQRVVDFGYAWQFYN
jgi:hypothetical protein